MYQFRPFILTAFWTCVLAATLPDSNLASDATRDTAQSFPVGDPQRCILLSKQNNFDIKRFQVLPGFGWDNLRNDDEGQVVWFNYSQCRTTDDGRFLLPDSVSATPVKSSKVQIFAELIGRWTKWTSATSRSINIDAGLNTVKYSISGKFSYDFSEVKSKQISDKTLTTRAQIRYVRYTVQLQPDTPLHPVFKRRVLSIAAAQELGELEKARFLAQMLVRDFGTHIINKADVGASLEQVDQIAESWMQRNQGEKRKILAAASASLFNVFHLSTSVESGSSNSFTEAYKTQRSSSRVLTNGGPPFLPANFTSSTWAAGVDSDLVPLDRSGKPLFYVLNGETLPELPGSTLTEVYERVKEAVETYYSYNTIPGCLDPTSPNFSPIANVNDESCKAPGTNLTFGGVFQTCKMTARSNNGNLCGGLQQVNPMTGDFSCKAGHTQIQLTNGSNTKSRVHHRCESYWIFWEKCYNDYYSSTANYATFWCVSTQNSVPDSGGYLFGGLFTSKLDNPVTQSDTCPPAFFPLSIGHQSDLRVCVSDDYELGRVNTLPFAGFFSCSSGNPLALTRHPQIVNGGHKSLMEFFENNSHDLPKRCPEGYSKHLALVNQGCQINYCVMNGALASTELANIKRPPFISSPPLAPSSSDDVLLFDPMTRTWKRNEDAMALMSLRDQDSAEKQESNMSTCIVARVSVIALLFCVVFMI